MRFHQLRLYLQIIFLAFVPNTQPQAFYGHNEIVTCKNKCGKIQTSYCSCDARCLIYKNCCEGIESDCPEILAEARIKFSHLLNSQVVCDEYAQHMISSCPQTNLDKETTWSSVEQTSDQNDPYNAFLMSTTPDGKGDDTIQAQTLIQSKGARSRLLVSRAQVRGSKKFPFQKISKLDAESELENLEGVVSDPKDSVTDPTEAVKAESQNKSEISLESVLRKVPVVQASSGLVFKNQEIFLCNGGKESETVWWDILVPHPGAVSIQVLDEVINPRKTTIYRPPSHYHGTMMNCKPLSRGVESCLEERLAENQTLGELCQSFKSYVNAIGSGRTYDNRFCMQCSRDAEKSFSPLPVFFHSGKGSPLSVLLSLNQKNSFTVTTRGAGNLPDFVSPWEDVTCQISDESTSHKNLDDFGKGETNGSADNPTFDKQQKGSLNLESFCATKSCSEHFKLQPNGKCKTEHIVLAGVSDDGFPLTMNQKTRLGDFLACGLERYLKTEILHTNGPTMTVYDDTQNRSVYIINATIRVPFVLGLMRNVYSRANSQKLLNIFLFVKAFKEFRKPRLQSECVFSQSLLKQKDSLDIWKKSQDDRNIKNMDGLLDMEGEALPTTNSVSIMGVTSYEINLLAKTGRGKPLSNSTTKFCIESIPLFKKMNLNKVYCLDDLEYEKDAEMLQTFCDSPCFSLLTQQDQRSASDDLQVPMAYKIMSCLILLIYMEPNVCCSFS